jgi:hypothetical protein
MDHMGSKTMVGLPQMGKSAERDPRPLEVEARQDPRFDGHAGMKGGPAFGRNASEREKGHFVATRGEVVRPFVCMDVVNVGDSQDPKQG